MAMIMILLLSAFLVGFGIWVADLPLELENENEDM